MSTMISLSGEMSPLSMEQMREKCPYAFRESPTNPGVSGKYVHANTMTVINDMMKLGWYPVEAKQCRQRKGSKGIRSFHIIALQNDDVKIYDMDGGTEAYVRIILQNSHDGFNSFKFMMGCYRVICSNGLILADAEFESFTIRHINYTFEELKRVVNEVVGRVPYVINRMNAMNRTRLNEVQMRELAASAFEIRGGRKENVRPEMLDEMLVPLRDEDKGDSLWKVFNVLQEKMMRGGYSVVNDKGRSRKARAIKSIKKDLEYNQRLWEVAEAYVTA